MRISYWSSDVCSSDLTELIDADWFDVLAIGRDYRHLPAGDTHIEVRHGRGIDETQTNLLARFESAGPVAIRCLAVHQVGVGVATARKSPRLTPVTNAHLVCRLLLETKNKNTNLH